MIEWTFWMAATGILTLVVVLRAIKDGIQYFRFVDGDTCWDGLHEPECHLQTWYITHLVTYMYVATDLYTATHLTVLQLHIILSSPSLYDGCNMLSKLWESLLMMNGLARPSSLDYPLGPPAQLLRLYSVQLPNCSEGVLTSSMVSCSGGCQSVWKSVHLLRLHNTSPIKTSYATKSFQSGDPLPGSPHSIWISMLPCNFHESWKTMFHLTIR